MNSGSFPFQDLLRHIRVRSGGFGLTMPICLVAAAFRAACADKSPTASGGAPSGTSGSVPQKPSPEQEAAKPRMIPQGPAIEAAIRLQEGK